MADNQRPPYDGSHGEFVKFSEAAACTKKYRHSNACTELKSKHGSYLGSRKILRLLSQKDAVGIRTYLGIDKEGFPQMFLVGVDSAGNDILAGDKGVENGENGLVLDNNAWCPIFCGNGNGLNQD